MADASSPGFSSEGALLDMVQVMSELATQRPPFHSEADFQLSLGWHLQVRHMAPRVHLDYRPAFPSQPRPQGHRARAAFEGSRARGRRE
jgi:hypothetical protein